MEPAGTRIAYERNKGLNSDIWIANADGTGAYQLTNDPDRCAAGMVQHRQEDRVRERPRRHARGIFDLFVVDTNAKNLANLTNTPAISEEYPSWSADGTAIAFSRDGDIYKMAPNGANLRQLTSTAVMEIEPDWHPTGGQIVYRTGINGTDNIWKMNADGTDQARSSTTGARSRSGPCGRRRATRSRSSAGAFKDAEVYTMNSDGTGVTRITNNTLMDASPAWQPIPLPASYVRPKTAAQSQFALVPAFRPCNVPNRIHGPPLANPSCAPPKQYSRYLTMGTSDANGRAANLDAFVKVTADRGDRRQPDR